jgi:hypothetical protein
MWAVATYEGYFTSSCRGLLIGEAASWISVADLESASSTVLRGLR